MRLSAQYDFPAGAERVAGLLASKDFVLAAAKRTHALSSEAAVSTTPDGAFTVTLRRTLPVDGLPAAARQFLPGGLEIRQAVAWEPPGPDGAREASVAGDIAGAPVHLIGTARLAPTKAGCRLDFDGEVKAAVPLLGRSIEEAAVPAIVKVLDAEHAEALDQLSA
ncbi:MAG: DUF2505 domain-containing protein [Bifidobacteriaceae bacterium]|jgi:hypothetical protein|nr:DUF2505 domain-containing protein [Bifidobacteriaceae bacterium]